MLIDPVQVSISWPQKQINSSSCWLACGSSHRMESQTTTKLAERIHPRRNWASAKCDLRPQKILLFHVQHRNLTGKLRNHKALPPVALCWFMDERRVWLGSDLAINFTIIKQSARILLPSSETTRRIKSYTIDRISRSHIKGIPGLKGEKTKAEPASSIYISAARRGKPSSRFSFMFCSLGGVNGRRRRREKVRRGLLFDAHFRVSSIPSHREWKNRFLELSWSPQPWRSYSGHEVYALASIKSLPGWDSPAGDEEVLA